MFSFKQQFCKKSTTKILLFFFIKALYTHVFNYNHTPVIFKLDDVSMHI